MRESAVSDGSTELVSVVSAGEDDTRRLAHHLAKCFVSGSALCLSGDLGAGKTVFAAGLVAALGGEGPVLSPTFTLENRYPMAGAPPILHLDLYRAEDHVDQELLASVLESRDEGARVIVEWGEAAADWLRPCWLIELRSEPGSETRRRLILHHGETDEAAQQVASAWRQEFA